MYKQGKRYRNLLKTFQKTGRFPKFDKLTSFHQDKLNTDPYPEPDFDDHLFIKISLEQKSIFVDKNFTIYFLIGLRK
jgi:hypothetical protein